MTQIVIIKMHPNTSPSRLFIAVDISSSVKNNIESIIQSLSASSPPHLRWDKIDKIHLTLKFLGETPFSLINDIKEKLRDVAETISPFKISLKGVGGFPNIEHPRVIWIGVNSNPNLESLQKQVDLSMHKLGFTQENRPFSAHLTICRVPDFIPMENIAVLSKLIGTLETPEFGSFFVNSIHLYKSQLKPEGSSYTCQFSTDLARLSA